MDETKAGQEAGALARKQIRQEQRYAERRAAKAKRECDPDTESFFSGYRNGLGYAYRCVIDATNKPARRAPPTPRSDK
jgi:hypothetical protein